MKINRLIILLLIFATLAVNAAEINLTEKEKAYIETNPSVKVSNELGWYPYDFYEQNTPNGYAIDYMKILASKIGLHVEFISDKWPALFKLFEDKKIDIIHPARKSSAREKIAIFSEPFISTNVSLITKINRNDIKAIEDLKGKTLATVKNWAVHKQIRSEYSDIKYIEFETSKEMLEAVAFSVADASVDDALTANYIINKEKFNNIHVVSKVVLKNPIAEHLYILFQKENHILQGLFNKALARVSEVEKLELRLKWLKDEKKYINNIIFTAEEKQYLKIKKIIKMCIDPNWMPFEMNENGEHIGMSADYMSIFQEKLGVPIEMVDTKTWSESIEFAKERKCDIYSMAMSTPSRKKYMDFTKSYLSVPLVLVTKLNEGFYSEVGSITNKNIGIVKGYAYDEILRVRYPNMKLVEVKNVSDGLDQVHKGKLFGFTGALISVGYNIQKNYPGTLKVADKYDELWELGVGVRNDEPLLLSTFNKIISNINNIEHQKILNKWISVNYEQKKDYSLILQIIGFFAVIFLIIIIKQFQLNKYNKKLKQISITDKLTGIYNRVKLDSVLLYEKDIFYRFKRPVSIILFDLDDFKLVNDNFGHQVGDDVLKEISKVILNVKRKTDTFGRWGGEEFLIICHETSLNGAKKLAEKFRKGIESHGFKTIKSQTASFGVATFEEGDSVEKVFSKVDKKLYEAKNSGKNVVCSI